MLPAVASLLAAFNLVNDKEARETEDLFDLGPVDPEDDNLKGAGKKKFSTPFYSVLE